MRRFRTSTGFVMIASLLFSQFIWRLAPIPSSHYPYAQELWHLQALNTLLMQTSTLEGNSLFFQALRGSYVFVGMVFGLLTYAVLSVLNLPVLLIYGVVRGLGQTAPHGHLLEVDFLERLRDIQPFSSVAQLQQQLAQDVRRTQELRDRYDAAKRRR